MAKFTELLEAQFPKSVCTIDVSRIVPGSVPPVSSFRQPVFESLAAGSPEFDLGFRTRWQLPVLSSRNEQLAVVTLLTRRTEFPTPQENDRLANKVKLAALTIEHRLMTDKLQWDAQHDRLTGLATGSYLNNACSVQSPPRAAGRPWRSSTSISTASSWSTILWDTKWAICS